MSTTDKVTITWNGYIRYKELLLLRFVRSEILSIFKPAHRATLLGVKNEYENKYYLAHSEFTTLLSTLTRYKDNILERYSSEDEEETKLRAELRAALKEGDELLIKAGELQKNFEKENAAGNYRLVDRPKQKAEG